jgi:hypothetical protein
MAARKFFYVCAGLFLLALSYHLGASTAGAQSGSPVAGVAFSGDGIVLVTPSGDTFFHHFGGGNLQAGYDAVFVNLGNFWSGAPTPALRESWGSLKARYAPSHAPTSQTPTNR